jgi:hypothetical protein
MNRIRRRNPLERLTPGRMIGLTQTPVTVSASSSFAGTGPWDAMDSENTSRIWAPSAGTAPQWLAVDFGRSVWVRRARILPVPNGQCPRSFQIEVWDGTTWTSIASRANINFTDYPQIIELPRTKTAQVRLFITAINTFGSVGSFTIWGERN